MTSSHGRPKQTNALQLSELNNGLAMMSKSFGCLHHHAHTRRWRCRRDEHRGGISSRREGSTIGLPLQGQEGPHAQLECPWQGRAHGGRNAYLYLR